jgi:flagellum-specific peptidoglycan hydrolase FlgJ
MPPSAFLGMLAGFAQQCQIRTGIPASVTLAQAALESEWGWTGTTVDVATHEVVHGQSIAITAKFRRYPEWIDSMLDHAKFLQANPRYRACFKELDGAGWARALQAAGYATDPDYAKKLIGIMQGRNLAFYDQVPA